MPLFPGHLKKKILNEVGRCETKRLSHYPPLPEASFSPLLGLMLVACLASSLAFGPGGLRAVVPRQLRSSRVGLAVALDDAPTEPLADTDAAEQPVPLDEQWAAAGVDTEVPEPPCGAHVLLVPCLARSCAPTAQGLPWVASTTVDGASAPVSTRRSKWARRPLVGLATLALGGPGDPRPSLTPAAGRKGKPRPDSRGTRSCFFLTSYSLTHPFTHSLTHPPTHSLTHSFTHSLTHPLTHSPTHPLTHLLTYSPTYSPTHRRL